MIHCRPVVPDPKGDLTRERNRLQANMRNPYKSANLKVGIAARLAVVKQELAALEAQTQ